MKLLIEAGVDMQTGNICIMTPLHPAAQSDYTDMTKLLVVEYLVREACVDVDVTNNDGHEAQSLAAENGHEDIAKLLSAIKEERAKTKTTNDKSS
ncbi:hypothetical protein CDD83_495 [Cordyceps sp. RAO-2017]|nr:hypothetical protein CDD83_495 [Cordyceps sp. RAO-2017]